MKVYKSCTDKHSGLHIVCVCDCEKYVISFPTLIHDSVLLIDFFYADAT